MELTEPIENINKRLTDYFGVAWNGWPIFRIVWSEDQLEKRFGTYDDYSRNGIWLRQVTEWREVPKYRQWIQQKYVLERLTVVPEVNQNELDTKISYEPIFVFEDKKGFPLPPKWEAAQFVIDTLKAAMGSGSMYPKYVDPEIKNPKEERIKRVNKLEAELFGNETDVTDALHYKQGIVVPGEKKQ